MEISFKFLIPKSFKCPRVGDSPPHPVKAVTAVNPDWTSLGGQRTLTVSFTETALKQVERFSADATDPDYRLDYLKSPQEAIQAVRDILREDPRSVYRRNKCQDRLYFCIVDTMHVTSWFDEVDNRCEVIRIMPYAIRKKAIDILREEEKVDQPSSS